MLRMQRLWSSLRRKWQNSKKKSRSKLIQKLKDLMVAADESPGVADKDLESVSDCSCSEDTLQLGNWDSSDDEEVLSEEDTQCWVPKLQETESESQDEDCEVLVRDRSCSRSQGQEEEEEEKGEELEEEEEEEEAGSDIWHSVLGNDGDDKATDSQSPGSEVWKGVAETEEDVGCVDEKAFSPSAKPEKPVKPEGYEEAVESLTDDPPTPVPVAAKTGGSKRKRGGGKTAQKKAKRDAKMGEEEAADEEAAEAPDEEAVELDEEAVAPDEVAVNPSTGSSADKKRGKLVRKKSSFDLLLSVKEKVEKVGKDKQDNPKGTGKRVKENKQGNGDQGKGKNKSKNKDIVTPAKSGDLSFKDSFEDPTYKTVISTLPPLALPQSEKHGKHSYTVLLGD